MPEAVVIGAGPAGSVAALLLARGGWHTTLIEQRIFPRDKVCGGCVSALGLATLTRIGLHTQLAAVGGSSLRFAELHAVSGRTVRFALPGEMLGVSRRAMDQALLSAARDAGVIVLQPWRSESIEDGSRPRVHARDLKQQRTQTIEADWVLVADGKPAAQAHQCRRHVRDFGIQAHFENVRGPRHTIELFGCRHAYVGLAPVEAGLLNIACAVPGHRIRACDGIPALFERMCRENAALGPPPGGRDALRSLACRPASASSCPRCLRASHHPDWQPRDRDRTDRGGGDGPGASQRGDRRRVAGR